VKVDVQFVFIHTITPPPLHLVLNYRRTSSIVGTNNVWMVSDRRFFFEKVFTNRLTLPWTEVEFEIEGKYAYPRNLRNNFWFSSLVRFSFLSRFMQSHNRATVHIESDVVIAEDFPIALFSKIDTPFAFPIVSDKRGIASTLFVRDKESADFLWNHCKDAVLKNPLASDMEILFDMWRRYPELVTRLPIAPYHLYKECREEKEKYPFSGYFDGHDFGVFIGGTNPWNKRGVSEIKSRMDGSHLNFDINTIIYDKKRKFISIQNFESGETHSLYSLHFTNKNPIFFTTNLLPAVLRIWLLLYARINKTFHPFVLVLMIFKSLRRRIINSEKQKEA